MHRPVLDSRPCHVRTRNPNHLSALSLLCLASLAFAAGGTATGTATAAPEGADLLVEKAREAAHTDRNAESARFFREAIDVDPSRRQALLLEYADQVTYSGQPKAAIPLYREVLSRKDLSRDEKVHALSGLALALSWSDRLGEALKVYDQLALESPGDLGVKRDAARALAWRGLHREARARLAALLAERPDDPGASFLLAQAERWSGRPDLAVATLHGLLEKRPGHREARALLDEIEREARPKAALSENLSNQSDGLRIITSHIEGVFFSGAGIGELGASVDNVQYSPDTGQGGDVLVWRPGLQGRRRLGDAWEVNARASVDLVRPREDAVARDVFTFDTWVTFWPRDAFRIDAGLSRQMFDNVRSLKLGLATLDGSLSVEVNPTERLRLKARGDLGEVTDGNRRVGWLAEGEFRLLDHPRILLGVRYSGFTFSELLDNGYFNPERYQAVVATLHAWGPIGSRVYWDVDGNWGREFADPGGEKPTWGLGGKLSWQVSDTFKLAAWGGHFDSRQASSGGFGRSWVGISLGVRL